MEKRLDDFHTPKPRKAAARTTVESVLSTVANVGTPLLSLLSGLLAAALILFSGYVLYDAFYTQEQAKSGWELLQYKPSIVEMQDDETPADLRNLLAEVNEDYRAWLTVYETNIDYPVVQGPDDLYYAYHDVYKETSLTGAIYLAAGNRPQMTDSYNLIYGHHMDNGAMFGGIDEFAAPDYFSGHRSGLIQTLEGNFDLRHYVRVMIVGLMLEIGVAGAAGYLFYITEDFRRNMVILDRWTPCMIGLFALALLVDFICFRYRGSRPKEDSVTDEQSENDANA